MWALTGCGMACLLPRSSRKRASQTVGSGCGHPREWEAGSAENVASFGSGRCGAGQPPRALAARRRVPPMQHEHVSVRVAKEPHQADACVDGIAEKLDSPGGELLTSGVDVGYSERHSRSARRERDVLGLGLPKGKCDVRRFELVGIGAAPGQAEHLPIEPARAGKVSRRHRNGVDTPDPDHFEQACNTQTHSAKKSGDLPVAPKVVGRSSTGTPAR
jgi:hypothetical protein